MSYGPCQFPTLGFVVERYQQRMVFVPEDFWALKLSIEKNGTQVQFSWRRERLFDRFSCLLFFEDVLDAVDATRNNDQGYVNSNGVLERGGRVTKVE